MHSSAEQPAIRLPGWVRPASKVNKWLLKAGLKIGTQHILTVRGRRSGKQRSTPVSLLTVDGHRYIVTAPAVKWLHNARDAGCGTLTRGRITEEARLIEVPLAERRRVVREFPRQVPHGVSVFGLPPDPNAFEAAAERLAAVRVEPVSAQGVRAA